MNLTMRSAPILSMLAWVVSACGTSDSAPVVSSGDSGVAASPSGQCQASQVRACTCPAAGTVPAGSGSQSCYQGYWLTCSCSGDAGVAYVPDTSGDCLPGRYEGTFSGLYSSGFSWGGLPVPVVAFDPLGGPGLALTLSGQSQGGGEFVEYTVSDGYIKGNADGVFPIEGVITGALNCNTKEFNGILDGWYALALDLGVDLNRGFFRGPVHAYYEAATRSFVHGTWNVLESSQGGALAPVTTAFQTGALSPGQIVQNLGGGGDWSATFAVPDSGTVQGDAAIRDAGGADAGP